MSKQDTIEIDDAVIDAVSKKTLESVEKTLEEKFKMPTADEIAEAFAAKTEKTVKKAISDEGDGGEEGTAKSGATKDRHLDKGIGALPKEMRFAQAVRAMKSGDASKVLEYNSFSVKEWSEKANYQNVTTTADGGALVPDPEFMAEVERLTNDYGVVARLADIRSTDRDSVTMLKGTNEISFTATSEATAQNAQKLTFSAETVTLQKYIATLVMTSEILEDSAIDIFQDATNEIARARAKLFDQLVFTDSTYGFLAADSGDTYKTRSVGAALTNLDFDDLLPAQYDVVGSARRNGRFFMHPTVWNHLRTRRIDNGGGAGTGVYIAGDPIGTITPTIDGIPVELVDVLPDTGDITSNETFAVFGDLSRIKMHVKRILETKVFDAGVVKDAGGSDINLITQDAWAMRATMRVVPQTRFQGAFVLLGTGTVS